jgi:hypothetical protein
MENEPQKPKTLIPSPFELPAVMSVNFHSASHALRRTPSASCSLRTTSLRTT